MNHLEINRAGWDKRTTLHVSSEFYDHESFLAGNTSLKEIELGLLGDIKGKKILHLQCHFGQDSLSLARMGADVTAVDLSPKAIETARQTASTLGLNVEFICSDVLAPDLLQGRTFDLIFATYGTIPWLPDLKSWAQLISSKLNIGGQLLMVEFHPVLNMYDDEMKELQYSYFNEAPITSESSSYAEKESEGIPYMVWNHPFSEILQVLLNQGLSLTHFNEYAFSPYPCFNGMIPHAEDRYIIERFGDKMPLCFSLMVRK